MMRARAQLLLLLSPRRLLDSDRQQVDALAGRLAAGLGRGLDRRRGRLAVAAAELSAVSPVATLARGFAIVRDAEGRLIRSVSQTRPGTAITIQLGDGSFGAQVTS